MARFLVTFALVGVPFGLALLGMWRGYRSRQARDRVTYAPLPDRDPPARPPDATVRYTGTTRDGNWIQRVALPGLFGRGPCALWVEEDGLVFQRDRGPAVLVRPVAVSIERGHAGQAAPTGRLLVVRWRHAMADGTPTELDSGFIVGSREQTAELAARARHLAGVTE